MKILCKILSHYSNYKVYEEEQVVKLICFRCGKVEKQYTFEQFRAIR